MKKLSQAERKAVDAWLAGIIVGCFPLLAHLAIFATSDGETNWTAEILIVTITNCGMAIVTCGLKALDRDPNQGLPPRIGGPMGVTAAFLLFGAILYGQVASGNHKHINWLAALIFLIFSIVPSLYLDLLLVRPKEAQPEAEARAAG